MQIAIIDQAIALDTVDIHARQKICRDGSVFNLGGWLFATNAQAPSAATDGLYSWDRPSGLSWSEDEEITVSVKIPAATPLVGGICGRTRAVRDALVDAISGVSNCADVTDADLAAITGTLVLSGEGITELAAMDFAGLTGVTRSGSDCNCRRAAWERCLTGCSPD